MTEKFILTELRKASENLLTRAQLLLNEAADPRYGELSGDLPTSMHAGDRPVRVAFVGQYGAGKSTLLKALTGIEDIEIGEGIVTGEVRTFDWNGIEILDTPGIHTEIRPDHDEITYAAILDSDLLVFVVTNELFDDRMAEHFRHLAIERGMASEMLLVVNKMNRAVNAEDTRGILLDDLRAMLAPCTPEQMRTVFVDGEVACLVQDDLSDPDNAELWRSYGLDPLVRNMNDLVAQRGLAAQQIAPLQQLEEVLIRAQALATDEGDLTRKAQRELLLQRRRQLLDAEQQVSRSFRNRLETAGSKVRDVGRRVSSSLTAETDPAQYEQRLVSAQRQIESTLEETAVALQDDLEDAMQRLDARLEQMKQHDLYLGVVDLLREHLPSPAVSRRTLDNLSKVGKCLHQVGNEVVKHSFRMNESAFSSIFKLNQYAKTDVHKFVLEAGKFFNKSFKPWEAVKITRNIANAGRVLAVAGVLLDIGTQIMADVQETQAERDLNQKRAEMQAAFNNVADAIEMTYDKRSNSFIAEALRPSLVQIDAQLEELDQDMDRSTALLTQLGPLLAETRRMMGQIRSVVSDTRSA